MRLALGNVGGVTFPNTIPDYVCFAYQDGWRMVGTGPEIEDLVNFIVSVWNSRIQLANINFQVLSKRWKQDVEYTSSVTEMVGNDAYQEIIRMGKIVVPIILRELETDPDHWFPALTAITGADPVTAEACGNLRQMADAWLKWGKEHGFSF